VRAVQLLLGHSNTEGRVRYLGVDVEDALTWPNGRMCDQCAGFTGFWVTAGYPFPTHCGYPIGSASTSKADTPGGLYAFAAFHREHSRPLIIDILWNEKHTTGDAPLL
jgi:hypothetical protein